jgi:uncharacterized protein YyaL (SSP411 family)
MLNVARARYRPNLAIAAAPEGADRPALLESRTAIDDRTAAWVCRHFACEAPTADPSELEGMLDSNLNP